MQPPTGFAHSIPNADESDPRPGAPFRGRQSGAFAEPFRQGRPCAGDARLHGAGGHAADRRRLINREAEGGDEHQGLALDDGQAIERAVEFVQFRRGQLRRRLGRATVEAFQCPAFRPPRRSCPRKALRRMRKTHARRSVPGSHCASSVMARRMASCTRSSARAASLARNRANARNCGSSPARAFRKSKGAPVMRYAGIWDSPDGTLAANHRGTTR